MARSKAGSRLLGNAQFRAVPLIVLLLITVSVGLFVVVRSFAASGSLSLIAASGNVGLGTTFTVILHENSGSEAVNAVQADLSYPVDKLQFVSIDASTSAFGISAAGSGGSGTISIARGNQGDLTGDQIVAKITFTTVGTGTAPVAFAGSSALIRSSDNTNVLVTKTPGSYTISDATAPSAPTSLHGTGSTMTSISLAWSPSTDNVGVTGYRIYRDNTQIGTSTGTTYADNSLAPGNSYSYAVAGVDAAGNVSAASATASLATAPDTASPSAPGVPSASNRTMNTLSLTWTPSTDNVAVTGYRIYRAATQIGTSSSTSFTDMGLVPNTSYSYMIAAVDAAGNLSTKSAPASLTTLADSAAPSAPTGLRATPSGNIVALAWNASADNVAVIGYKVYRSGTQVGTSTSTSYTDTSVPSGSYNYTVAAYDAAGNTSAQSTGAAVTVSVKGDVNGDGRVDVLDLSTLLSNWGRAGAGDLNNDGTVGIVDLSIMLSAWTG